MAASFDVLNLPGCHDPAILRRIDGDRPVAYSDARCRNARSVARGRCRFMVVQAQTGERAQCRRAYRDGPNHSPIGRGSSTPHERNDSQASGDVAC